MHFKDSDCKKKKKQKKKAPVITPGVPTAAADLQAASDVQRFLIFLGVDLLVLYTVQARAGL